MACHDFQKIWILIWLKNLKKVFSNVLHDLSLLGLEAKLTNEKRLKVGIDYTLRYKGPLYDGRDVTIGNIKIDISFRNDMLLKPELFTISSEYSDVEPFLAYCMPVEEIFAEKIRALIKRGKARDIYDVWFLLNKNVKTDVSLIKRKIELQGLELDMGVLEKRIENKEKDWKKRAFSIN
jgi:hypothetical protein